MKKKKTLVLVYEDFPGGTVVKNLPANARDARDEDSIPGSGRSPGVPAGIVTAPAFVEMVPPVEPLFAILPEMEPFGP